MKKQGAFALAVIVLLLLPSVFAQTNTISLDNPLSAIWEPIHSQFSKIPGLGVKDKEIATRFILFIALFAAIFGVLKWLGAKGGMEWLGSKNIDVVLAFAVSAISVVFMSTEAVLTIGESYGQLAILAAFGPIIGLLVVLAIQARKSGKCYFSIPIILVTYYFVLYCRILFHQGNTTGLIVMFKDSAEKITGIADLILWVAAAILPIWLIVEIFMCLSMLGGESASHAGGNDGGHDEHGNNDEHGNDPHNTATGNDPHPTLTLMPDKGHPGDNILPSVEISGGEPPYDVNCFVNGTSHARVTTPATHFTLKGINTTGWPLGTHGVTVNVCDKKKAKGADGKWFTLESATGPTSTGTGLVVQIHKPSEMEQFEIGKKIDIEAEVDNFNNPFRILWEFHEDGNPAALFHGLKGAQSARDQLWEIPGSTTGKLPAGIYEIAVEVREPGSPPGAATHTRKIELVAKTTTPGTKKIKKFSGPQFSHLKNYFDYVSSTRDLDNIKFLWEIFHWQANTLVKSRLLQFAHATAELIRLRSEIESIPASDPRHKKLLAIRSDVTKFLHLTKQAQYVLNVNYKNFDDGFMNGPYNAQYEKILRAIAPNLVVNAASGSVVLGKTLNDFYIEVNNLPAPQQNNIQKIILGPEVRHMVIGTFHPIRTQAIHLMLYVLNALKEYEKIEKKLP